MSKKGHNKLDFFVKNYRFLFVISHMSTRNPVKVSEFWSTSATLGRRQVYV